MTRGPLDRIDAGLFATMATAAGVDRWAGAISGEIGNPGAGLAARFVEQSVAAFEWGGLPVYVTAADALALASGVVLLVRFAAWALSPLFALILRGRR
ncbi:hypothetical protein [Oceanicella actignis]|uniref:Uncharacterized protein n=1 Tax=Oceanicella actignis TaxID=1189325 RepID=A0A1M7U1A6_9RHOB|nr:hypothetical protein [Oceanicella actignis]SES77304.1 hypothetical protein SAMN04488119_101418 [Oceanicella actignis]SHN76806.1 hypothetical protein SAMN05216200_1144 [Oceanicella actignis]